LLVAVAVVVVNLQQTLVLVEDLVVHMLVVEMVPLEQDLLLLTQEEHSQDLLIQVAVVEVQITAKEEMVVLVLS
jgi:hypothetical protein